VQNWFDICRMGLVLSFAIVAAKMATPCSHVLYNDLRLFDFELQNSQRSTHARCYAMGILQNKPGWSLVPHTGVLYLSLSYMLSLFRQFYGPFIFINSLFLWILISIFFSVLYYFPPRKFGGSSLLRSVFMVCSIIMISLNLSYPKISQFLNLM
jgi:hypothetical protein